MNPANTLKMAEMLCTRLCHDLTGPIGAVHNGAEFLKESGAQLQDQAVDLIVSSAAEAVNRLQFYRRAYGRINEDGEASLSEQKLACVDFFRGSKIQLDWPDLHTDASGVPVSRKLARLILNLIIIASHSLIRGGTVAVRISGGKETDGTESTKVITLTAQGANVKWDKDLEQVLSGKTDFSALTPKTIQPFMTYQLTEEVGARLSWNVSDTELTLTVTQGKS